MIPQARTALGALPAVAAAAAVAALVAPPASSDPPPAAAGSTLHGFLFEDEAVRTIDHPFATTVPAVPNGNAGTGTAFREPHVSVSPSRRLDVLPTDVVNAADRWSASE